MKLYKISLALLMGIGTLTSCSDKLDVSNPNQPIAENFGQTAKDLEEAVIACYHHTRMEGTFARVGFAHDIVRGDEVWNASQVWYLPIDNFNEAVTDEIGALWIWRDWYYVINISNFVITRCEEYAAEHELNDQWKRIKGQALFTRALGYYNLAGYYQNPTLILDYNQYQTLEGLQSANWEEGDADGNAQYDRVMDQVEKDFAEAMTLLPSRDEGGEWANGRATSGAAAGFYARALMMRHKYSEALAVLKDILNSSEGGNKKYGSYKLMENYGDNFQQGTKYENNEESLYEVQFLDYGSQGTDDEWTPVNISKNASQGHAIESNFGPGASGGWADLSAAPWLYHLFVDGEKTTKGGLDPRLYWTIGTYESDWDVLPNSNGNVCYTEDMSADKVIPTNNDNGGLPIAKWTNFRTSLYKTVVVGLKCGINLRIMRYSDVLLRAAECENEVNGPTAQAIEWINVVRRRAGLADLKLTDFAGDADKLFEQIANVERPKEFGCEWGRGFDLLRWGFFYQDDRIQQMKEHTTYRLMSEAARDAKDYSMLKQTVSYSEISDEKVKSSFDTYKPGHEFLPIFQNTLNDNPNLRGNSANNNTDNSSWFKSKGWTIHPVVK